MKYGMMVNGALVFVIISANGKFEIVSDDQPHTHQETHEVYTWGFGTSAHGSTTTSSAVAVLGGLTFTKIK